MLFIQLILAHLLADFVFQPSSWVKNKVKHKIKSKKLYAHIAVHTLFLIIIALIHPEFWIGLPIVVISHFVIDLLKVSLHKKVAKQLLFFSDQILHFIFIGIACYIVSPFEIDINSLITEKILILLIGLIFICFVAPIIIRLIIMQWDPEKDKLDRKESLEKAGKYIGILERLFVFTFVILHKWEGVGFLLAAKSIFRFGDLTTAKDRKLTEYILIGTLISFGLAILAGLAYNSAIQYF